MIKRLWGALPDRYLALAFASWGAMMPLLMSAFSNVAGEDTGGGWFYVSLPGAAMCVGGTFGNCMVIAAALDMRIKFPWVTRWAVLAWAFLCFAATVYLIKSHLHASYVHGGQLGKLLEPAELGMFFYCFLAMAEGPTAPLVFLSQITKSARATVERSVQDATGTDSKILLELIAGGKTAKELADVEGLPRVATIGKHLKDMAKEDPPRVHSVEMGGSAAAVWKIGAVP